MLFFTLAKYVISQTVAIEKLHNDVDVLSVSERVEVADDVRVA
jgi:hypothetical protein